jgi:hypothetical protein
MLLKQIRLEIQKELHVEHPMLEHGDSCQPMYQIMVMKILKEAKEVNSAARGRQDSRAKGPQLEVVGRVLKKYLDLQERLARAAT